MADRVTEALEVGQGIIHESNVMIEKAGARPMAIAFLFSVAVGLAFAIAFVYVTFKFLAYKDTRNTDLYKSMDAQYEIKGRFRTLQDTVQTLIIVVKERDERIKAQDLEIDQLKELNKNRK